MPLPLARVLESLPPVQKWLVRRMLTLLAQCSELPDASRPLRNITYQVIVLLLPLLYVCLTACSVQKACDKVGAGASGAPTGPGEAKVDSNNPDGCRVFDHVATICRLDTGMSRMAGKSCGTQMP